MFQIIITFFPPSPLLGRIDQSSLSGTSFSFINARGRVVALQFNLNNGQLRSLVVWVWVRVQPSRARVLSWLLIPEAF